VTVYSADIVIWNALRDRLMSVLSYDPETGLFVWRVSVNSRARAGSVAGCIATRGYRIIYFDKAKYPAHRLAWFYIHGVWPPEYIDHINGDTSDNRIANLRPATNAQNQANSRKHRDNRSGLKGVTWDNWAGKWKTQIKSGGRSKFLGLFDAKEDAHRAYERAARELNGEYARSA
jgi:hypothetical protein